MSQRLIPRSSLGEYDLHRLIEGCIHILNIDQEEHPANVQRFLHFQNANNKSTSFMDRFENNLQKAEIRTDYFTELISRINSLECLTTITALQRMDEQISKSSKGYMVHFENQMPQIFIL